MDQRAEHVDRVGPRDAAGAGAEETVEDLVEDLELMGVLHQGQAQQGAYPCALRHPAQGQGVHGVEALPRGDPDAPFPQGDDKPGENMLHGYLRSLAANSSTCSMSA